VVSLLNERGYIAKWEKADDGYYLHTNNCPYRDISRDHTEVCVMDMTLISDLLAPCQSAFRGRPAARPVAPTTFRCRSPNPNNLTHPHPFLVDRHASRAGLGYGFIVQNQFGGKNMGTMMSDSVVETPTSTDGFMLTLTDVAVVKIQAILKERNVPNHGLRVFVAGVGCSGLQYGMALESQAHDKTPSLNRTASNCL